MFSEKIQCFTSHKYKDIDKLLQSEMPYFPMQHPQFEGNTVAKAAIKVASQRDGGSIIYMLPCDCSIVTSLSLHYPIFVPVKPMLDSI